MFSSVATCGGDVEVVGYSRKKFCESIGVGESDMRAWEGE